MGGGGSNDDIRESRTKLAGQRKHTEKLTSARGNSDILRQ
jgi:hypothetical protein